MKKKNLGSTIKKQTLLLSLMCLFYGACNAGGTAGWPGWRGEQGNGTVQTERFNPFFPESADSVLWTSQVGEGFASMTVADGRLYTAGQVESAEGLNNYLTCLDASDGTLIWTRDLPSREDSKRFSPRSQPVLDGSVLYYLSPDAILSAYRAGNGRLLWSVDLQREYKALPPQFGITASPLIVDDQIILNLCETGLALDKKTGQVLWNSEMGVNGYASPVLLEEQERSAVVLLGEKNLSVVSVQDGSVLFLIPLSSSKQLFAADPLITADGTVFVTSVGLGSLLIDYRAEEKSLLWKKEEPAGQFSSPLLYGGFIYTVHGSTHTRNRCYLVCLDPASGEILWREKLGSYASLIAVNETLIVLDENGTLMTVSADPGEFRLLAKKRIYTGRGVAWVAPVFAEGRLYLRSNAGQVVCLKAE